MRRRSEYTDASAEKVIKFKSAEARLKELKSSMSALGREASEAMMSVEDQQEQIALLKPLTMVTTRTTFSEGSMLLSLMAATYGIWQGRK